MNTLAAPTMWVESIGNLRLPGKSDRRLQELMDRNNEGLLTEHEREQLELLVELSETLALARAKAIQSQGRVGG